MDDIIIHAQAWSQNLITIPLLCSAVLYSTKLHLKTKSEIRIMGMAYLAVYIFNNNIKVQGFYLRWDGRWEGGSKMGQNRMT